MFQQNKLVQIEHLQDYSKCPNYARLNWNNHKPTENFPLSKVLKSIYSDKSNLNKSTNWKTIRSRLTTEILNYSKKNHYSTSVKLLDTVRDWYIKYFRDDESEVICNINLSQTVHDIVLKSTIDAIVLYEKNAELIYFTDKGVLEDILRDLDLKVKVFLLQEQSIKIRYIMILSCTETSFHFWRVNLNQLKYWVDSIPSTVRMITFGINNKVFYPSPTQMCNTCKYKKSCL